MADGPYRHYGAGTGQQQQFYYQQQNHHRHLNRNASPVNNGRPSYNETPSPSRSPVSQNSSNPFGMYNPNQMQSSMMNGAGGSHHRYMQGVGHKYPHQPHQQQQHHHGQQNHHHHQQNHGVHTGHGAMGGHQHTFSGGMNLNSNQPYNQALQNGTLNDDPTEIDENLPEHWQQQLQLLAEIRQSGLQSHRHSRKGGATLASRANANAQAEESQDEQVERNRAVAVQEEPRQDWDGMDMSGQGLRCISMRLFQDYSFLTKLFIDNNKLSLLPFGISTLRHLTLLQASNNQLRELPESIGMLSRLEQLLVFDNQIRTLPSEIGYLFKLEMLGIEGNPLDEDTKDFLIQNGTQGLVAHLRDNAQPGELPRERPLHVLDESEVAETVAVLNWNILCDKYVSRTHYAHVPVKALEWPYRRDLVMETIKSMPADIICLQELDQDNFNEHFRRELAIQGYKGLFWPKSRARTMSEREAKLVDGCAIFYKATKYILLDKQLIDFANTAINRPDMKGEHDIFNRVMPRDHIAVAAFFENRTTGSRMIVANAHIHWDPKFEDVKIVQVAIMIDQLAKFADKWSRHEPLTPSEKALPRHAEADPETSTTGDPSDPASTTNPQDLPPPTPAPVEPGPSLKYSSGTSIPLILAGDFNSHKSSAIYELLSRGSLPRSIPEFAGRSYGSFTRGEGISHPFTLRNAYASDASHSSSISSYIPNSTGPVSTPFPSSSTSVGMNGNTNGIAARPGAEEDYIAITNYTPDFQGCIEYVWHSPGLRRRKVLGNVDFEYLGKVPGFPDWHFPSDHLALWVEFGVEQQGKKNAGIAAGDGRGFGRGKM